MLAVTETTVDCNGGILLRSWLIGGTALASDEPANPESFLEILGMC